ncbi:MAG: CBS domain-containing protein [Deltaproteobacteria bacterium]|nr:CBS domain-containing protein [Deltaproteobacteria bacterium]MBW2413351.1 CBS domain-containing protein [Deltaproteobacteria bacterium]
MRVQDVMQKGIISVSPELALKDFEELLTGEDISGAPVTGSDGKLVGVASKTDIVRALAEDASQRDILAPELSVEDIMTTDVITVAPDAELRAVARMMIDGNLHRVIVTDGDDVLGIVTTFDLLSAVY